MNDIIRSWPAPAKLNLFLHVLGRREDGYHEIQTLFQLIDLCDELTFDVQSEAGITRHESTYGVPETDDLVVRAARLLQVETGIRKGVHIRVNKQIPLGAGLGGGSSDAATTLLALNSIWSCGLTQEELSRLGRQLGADVPVFVRGRSAWAGGVGDALTPVEMGPRNYVLVFNPYPVSTAAVFEHPDLKRNSLAFDFHGLPPAAGENDCLAVAIRLRPELGALMKDLAAWGEPHLTGTGSCIFLPMDDEIAAAETALRMKCRYNVRAVRGLDRSPVHEMLDLLSRNE